MVELVPRRSLLESLPVVATEQPKPKPSNSKRRRFPSMKDPQVLLAEAQDKEPQALFSKALGISPS